MCSAVGVSSAFRAPVGGLLFSLESTTTSYLLSAYGKGFFAAVVGTVFVYLYTPEEEAVFLPIELELDPFGKVELFFFFLMGVVGGLVGAGFVFLYQALFHKHRRLRIWTNTGRWPDFPRLYTLLLYPVALSLVTGLSTFPLGRITQVSLRETMINLYCNCSLTDPGVTNFTTNGNVFERLAFEPELGPYGTMTLYMVLIFFLTICSTLIALPVGIFLPTAAVGAAAGRLIGEGLAVALPHLNIRPAAYAVVGTAALAAGVTRSMSTAVVIFEATGSLSVAVPVALAVVTAVNVGNRLTPAIYDAMLECLSLPYLPRTVPADKLLETAATLMLPLTQLDGDESDPGDGDQFDTPPVVQRHTTLGELFQVLQTEPSDFREDIAVVDSFEHHILIGTVRRKALRRACVDSHHAILFKTLAITEDDEKTMLERHMTNPDHFRHQHEHMDATARVKGFAEFISRTHNVSVGAGREHQQGILDAPVDLFKLPGLVLNASPLQVEVHTPVSELVHMLSLMHRRYAFVVEFGRLSGVVTFSCIVKALHVAKRVRRRNAGAATFGHASAVQHQHPRLAVRRRTDSKRESEHVREVAKLWQAKAKTGRGSLRKPASSTAPASLSSLSPAVAGEPNDATRPAAAPPSANGNGLHRRAMAGSGGGGGQTSFRAAPLTPQRRSAGSGAARGERQRPGRTVMDTIYDVSEEAAADAAAAPGPAGSGAGPAADTVLIIPPAGGEYLESVV